MLINTFHNNNKYYTNYDIGYIVFHNDFFVVTQTLNRSQYLSTIRHSTVFFSADLCSCEYEKNNERNYVRSIDYELRSHW